jgi:hypothetical protein
MMDARRDLWRAVRWPVLVLAVAGLGIGVAAALDRTAAREWALTIGGTWSSAAGAARRPDRSHLAGGETPRVEGIRGRAGAETTALRSSRYRATSAGRNSTNAVQVAADRIQLSAK